MVTIKSVSYHAIFVYLCAKLVVPIVFMGESPIGKHTMQNYFLKAYEWMIRCLLYKR